MKKDNWISTNESMPEIRPISTMSDWVLVYDSEADDVEKAFYSNVTGWQCQEGELTHVTHWMPLPYPPKDR